MLGAEGLWKLCVMYSNTFQWLKRFWIAVSLHIKILLTVRKIKTKAMFLNHTCNIINNCKSKSLIKDSNDGTLQLAVLWFWTCTLCGVLNRMHYRNWVCFYWQTKMVERNHWIRPLISINRLGPVMKLQNCFIVLILHVIWDVILQSCK
jgi:hypothetical protein